MEYYLDYPITQLPGKAITISWTKAYRNVNATFNEEVLFENKTFQQLKKGVNVNHDLLGKIEIKFSKEKLVLNVIVDGIHSPINKDHPIHKIKNYSTYIWIIFGGTCLTLLSDLLTAMSMPLLIVIIIGPLFTLGALFVYLYSAIQLKKGKSLFFWIASGVYAFRVLLLLTLVLSGIFQFDGLGIFIGFIFRFSFMIALLFAIPKIIQYQKHEKYIFKNQDEELIDN
jgi:hypothetical protein